MCNSGPYPCSVLIFTLLHASLSFVTRFAVSVIPYLRFAPLVCYILRQLMLDSTTLLPLFLPAFYFFVC